MATISNVTDIRLLISKIRMSIQRSAPRTHFSLSRYGDCWRHNAVKTELAQLSHQLAVRNVSLNNFSFQSGIWSNLDLFFNNRRMYVIMYIHMHTKLPVYCTRNGARVPLPCLALSTHRTVRHVQCKYKLRVIG